MGRSARGSRAVKVPDREQGSLTAPALSRNMVILNEEFGFDTVDTREQCLRFAELPAGAMVLDVGTGSGWMAIVLARAGMRVVSIDVDASALVRARERIRAEAPAVCERIVLLRADAGALPFADATVAHVFSYDAMHHLPHCAKALQEMRRVCGRGGRVVVADLNERGLAAVRSVVARNGGRHDANACQPDAIERLIERCCGRSRRRDLGFVTVFDVGVGGGISTVQQRDLLAAPSSSHPPARRSARNPRPGVR